MIQERGLLRRHLPAMTLDFPQGGGDILPGVRIVRLQVPFLDLAAMKKVKRDDSEQPEIFMAPFNRSYGTEAMAPKRNSAGARSLNEIDSYLNCAQQAELPTGCDKSSPCLLSSTKIFPGSHDAGRCYR